VLFVGSEHPRKNLAGLLRAFALLKRGGGNPGLRLVKVGEPGSAEARYRRATAALVGELGLGADVVFTGWVPDEDLRALYSGAVCTVLPSLAEGFGLPPLEAMACGCPVVVSNAGALPEIAGGAAVVVDPGDVEELARALHALAGDAAARAELSALGLARAARFSWGRTAAETAHAYDTLLRSTPRPAAAA
jgi:glycosyltransferase involved in cell wall biosynthesis